MIIVDCSKVDFTVLWTHQIHFPPSLLVDFFPQTVVEFKRNALLERYKTFIRLLINDIDEKTAYLRRHTDTVGNFMQNAEVSWLIQTVFLVGLLHFLGNPEEKKNHLSVIG